MLAPAQIINSLESILEILLSNVHYRERAVFILCDNLVELSCRIKIKENNSKYNEDNFHKVLSDSKIPDKLMGIFKNRRWTRNNMQHGDLRTTVDIKECADFVLDIIKLIQNFWGEYALQNTDEWFECSLRIMKLYSSEGKRSLRRRFENYIANEMDFTNEDSKYKSMPETKEGDESAEIVNIDENGKILIKKGRKRLPEKHELIIPVNSKENLGIIIQEFSQQINEILDELELEE